MLNEYYAPTDRLRICRTWVKNIRLVIPWVYRMNDYGSTYTSQKNILWYGLFIG